MSIISSYSAYVPTYYTSNFPQSQYSLFAKQFFRIFPFVIARNGEPQANRDAAIFGNYN